ncbi:Hypothetical Protein FCC1311_077452 [Hondaea fermentalgiana]|uniref:Uncharacterized protein n=1 Tax=Hondaea fermentalgiana TaxID=2315210 RepID=A0A2R5GT12_9STRA|nr:Hypothetical Protein FCC1311_077452 [Hondaea fermentalgiana]|eukprot:GBG31521.1 Hypothetical Protein FCC1311_077452 [Hondaea fermentalgiana]
MASKRKTRGREVGMALPPGLGGEGLGAQFEGEAGPGEAGTTTGGAVGAAADTGAAVDLGVHSGRRQPTTAELIKATDAEFIRRTWEEQYERVGKKLLSPPPAIENILFTPVKTSVLKAHGVKFYVHDDKEGGSDTHYFLCLAEDGECLRRGNAPIIRIQDSSTARATRHLKITHGVIPNKTRSAEAKRAVVDARTEIMTDCVKSAPKRTLQHLVALLANRGSWSYSTFKLQEWRVLCRLFGVERELATQMDVVQIMTEQYAYIRNSIRDRIAAARVQAQGLPFLSVSLDLSSNPMQRRRLVSVRVSFVGENNDVESYNLAIRSYKPCRQVTKHARVLYQFLDGVLKHFGVSGDMVLTAVARGGPELLQQLFVKEMIGARFELCLSHILQMAVRDALNEIRELLNRMGDTIAYVSKLSHETLFFNIQRELFKTEPARLIRFADQNWLALEPVLRRFVDLGPAIEEFYKRIKEKSPMRVNEMDAVHEVLSILQPFYEVQEMSQDTGLVCLDTVACLQSAIIALKNRNHVRMVPRAIPNGEGAIAEMFQDRPVAELTESAARASVKLLSQLDTSYFDRFHAARALQDHDRSRILRFVHENRQNGDAVYDVKAQELKFSFVFETLFFLHPKTKSLELIEAIVMRHFANISSTELGDLVAPNDAASHHQRMLRQYIINTVEDMCIRVAEIAAGGGPPPSMPPPPPPPLDAQQARGVSSIPADEDLEGGHHGDQDLDGSVEADAWEASGDVGFANGPPPVAGVPARPAKRARQSAGTDYLDVLFAAVGRSRTDAPEAPPEAPAEAPRAQAHREISRYVSMEVTEEMQTLQGSELLRWWAGKSRQFPLLSTVALCMLGTIPSCAVNDAPRQNRSRLSTANVDLSTAVALNKDILPEELHTIPVLGRKQASDLRNDLEVTFNFPELEGEGIDDEVLPPSHASAAAGATLDLGEDSEMADL